MILIESALTETTVGDSSTFHNLTIFPLLKTGTQGASYHTLDEALALGGIHVTEESESANVSGLRVVNTLDRPALLLDGEEIVGAKQNRVFNLTILVPANAELLVPVSCVEAGCWSHVSPEFKTAPRAQYAAGRSARMAQVSDSLAARGMAASDQSQVWQSIAAKQRRMGVVSETGAMAEMYERFAGNVDEYVQGLPARGSQVGAVFAIGAQIVGMDIFDAGSTLFSLLPKLVRSYALDAIEAAPPTTVPGPETVAAFLAAVGAAETRSFPAVGLGEDLRLQGAGVSGAALVEADHIVHLCAFRAAASGGPVTETTIRRASARRRNFE